MTIIEFIEMHAIGLGVIAIFTISFIGELVYHFINNRSLKRKIDK